MTIHFDGCGPPSLVAALPQEKTYNVAALSRESNAFGGAAVIKVVTVGYSERRRGEKYFLYQDADTEVFQKPSNNPNEMIVGWSFRPVLGRKAVSPGLRQVFAVISVPAAASSAGVHPVNITTTTYWRKYDSKRLTLDREVDRVPQKPYPVDVITPDKAESGLASGVTKVRWVVTGNKSAVVLVEGSNFFTGTSVFMGGQTHSDAATGLQLKSDKALQVETTLDDLLTGDAVLNGRYGRSKPLEVQSPDGVEIHKVDPQPWLGADVITLQIQITKPGQGELALNEVTEKSDPIISVGGKNFIGIVPRSSRCVKFDREGREISRVACVEYSIGIPAALLAAATDVVVRWPFYGSQWTARERISPITTDIKVVALGTIGSGSQTVKRLGITGTGFTPTWIVIADKEYNAASGLKVYDSGNLMTVDIPSTTFGSLDSVVVRNPGTANSFVLPLPKAKPDPVGVTVKNPAPATVPVAFAGGVEFMGTGLSRVKKVLFGTDELLFSASNEKMNVLITRKVSEKEGLVALAFVVDDDSKQFAQFEVKDPPKPPAAK
jgi:hypothetical protein